MADYSTMKGPELEEILIKRGFKQVRKMGKAQKLELAMSGATPTSVVSLDPPVTPPNLSTVPVPELIKIIKRKAPDMKGYTKKPKSELVAIIEGLGTSLDTKPKPKPKRPVVKRPAITTKVEKKTRGAAEEAVAPDEAAARAKAKREKEEREKPPPTKFIVYPGNLVMEETERDRQIRDELKKKRDARRKVPISTSSLTSSATFSLFEKKNKAELLEEAKKLGLKGMGPKKKEEVLSAVVNETDRRSSAAEEPPKPERPKPERPKIPKPPKAKPKIVSSAILKEEAKKAEEAEEEIEYDEDGAPVNKYPGESKGAVDMEWQNMTPFPKPSLQTFEKISGYTVEESFDRILIIMEVLFFLKRSKKTFIMDWGEGKTEVNTNGIYNLLDKYYNELRILFGQATKFWKITQQEKNKMRAKAEELTDTDKKRYDVITDFIEPEMGLEFEELGDTYFLRVINEKEQEEEGYYTKETGGYESAEGYVGTFLQMFLEDENIEEYVIEAKRLERLEEQKEEEDEEALRARDIVQPLELEKGQDWKTLSLPKKVRYFLSMVDYEPRSMGQIERQSQAKIDRFIERARYDYGEDEKMPEHYFPSWNSEENLEFGVNMFEEYNWRKADQVPKDTENVPREPGRFFKGVFIEDDEEYIVNYFGMYGVKDVIEDEIKSKGLNEWRKLSWVKYKRFNFWQRPIVLEMTKGPMMIVPPYNIYDIRQSTSGVRPIQGVFEFTGQGGFRRLEPDDFESIQDELVASYTERLEESEEESEDESEEEERPVSGLPQQEMLSPPADELEERMASLSVSSLPPNEQELLPDATPPVEKEEVVEVDITPPNIYNQMGVLLPAGILPPDEDARVMPMASIHAGDAPPSTVGELIKVALGDRDWGIDRPDFVTVEDEDQDLPNESGIIWLFAEILNREDPTETNFIAACEDDFESQITIDRRDVFKTIVDNAFDINTGDYIGQIERPDEDDERKFIEYIPIADIKKPKSKPKLKPTRQDSDSEEEEEEELDPFNYDGEEYFKDRLGIIYMIDKKGEYDAIGVLNDDKTVHFY